MSDPNFSADPAQPTKNPRTKRLTRKQRALRIKRVLARLTEGRSLQAIADEEGLTRKRMREIVKKAADERKDDPKLFLAEAQIARLMPAIALAQKRIAEGDVRGIWALALAQQRLDVYQAITNFVDTPTHADHARSAIKKVEHFLMTARPMPDDEIEAYRHPPRPSE